MWVLRGGHAHFDYDHESFNSTFRRWCSQLPIPLANGATPGVAVAVGAPDLSKLGKTYNLDPYIRSLVGVRVPIGPVPGKRL